MSVGATVFVNPDCQVPHTRGVVTTGARRFMKRGAATVMAGVARRRRAVGVAATQRYGRLSVGVRRGFRAPRKVGGMQPA